MDQNGNFAVVTSRVSRYAKLSLVFGVLSVLKSAADRDRLEGGTFIQLNYLSSFLFLTMACKYQHSVKDVISIFCRSAVDNTVIYTII